ncbi:MAG: carbohydrate ABC transporter permease [Saccharofermentanales bacterium]
MKSIKFRGAKLFSFQRSKSLIGFTFVIPWLVGFFWLFFIPLVRTMFISVGEITNKLDFTIEYRGFQNYIHAFYGDVSFVPMFLNVVRDTLINVPLITVFSIYIAILLNRKIRGKGIFKVICFLPVILGTGFIMQQLLHQNVDAASISKVRELLLPKQVVAYIGPDIANGVLFFLNRLTVILWRSGVQILIFLSGLQSIPSSLYEASKVDGATEWENLWFITMPMMTPMILLNMIYTLVDSFTDASNPIIEYIINYGFKWNNFEYAAAMGCIYLSLVMIIVGVIFLTFRKSVNNMRT